MILEIGLRLFHFSFSLSRTVPCPSKCNVQIRRLRLSSSSSYRHFARDDPGKAKASHIAMTLQLNRQQKNAITWSRPVRSVRPLVRSNQQQTQVNKNDSIFSSSSSIFFFIPKIILCSSTCTLHSRWISRRNDRVSSYWNKYSTLGGPFFRWRTPILFFLFYFITPLLLLLLFCTISSALGTGVPRLPLFFFFLFFFK